MADIMQFLNARPSEGGDSGNDMAKILLIKLLMEMMAKIDSPEQEEDKPPTVNDEGEIRVRPRIEPLG